MSGRWAVLVIWPDGEQEYARVGATPGGPIATFSKREAKARADFLRAGLEEDEVQSVNVVREPKGAR